MQVRTDRTCHAVGAACKPHNSVWASRVARGATCLGLRLVAHDTYVRTTPRSRYSVGNSGSVNLGNVGVDLDLKHYIEPSVDAFLGINDPRNKIRRSTIIAPAQDDFRRSILFSTATSKIILFSTLFSTVVRVIVENKPF